MIHSKGVVNLAPNSATLMDLIEGVVPSFFYFNKDFLTVEDFSQEGVPQPDEVDEVNDY